MQRKTEEETCLKKKALVNWQQSVEYNQSTGK